MYIKKITEANFICLQAVSWRFLVNHDDWRGEIFVKQPVSKSTSLVFVHTALHWALYHLWFQSTFKSYVFKQVWSCPCWDQMSLNNTNPTQHFNKTNLFYMLWHCHCVHREFLHTGQWLYQEKGQSLTKFVFYLCWRTNSTLVNHLFQVKTQLFFITPYCSLCSTVLQSWP